MLTVASNMVDIFLTQRIHASGWLFDLKLMLERIFLQHVEVPVHYGSYFSVDRYLCLHEHFVRHPVEAALPYLFEISNSKVVLHVLPNGNKHPR